MTIEYLTIEKFQPRADAAAINQSANTNWTLRYNTITLNAPGAGITPTPITSLSTTA